MDDPARTLPWGEGDAGSPVSRHDAVTRWLHVSSSATTSMKAAPLLSSLATVESSAPTYDPGCGCASRTSDADGQPLDVDPAIKDRNIKRLRRVEGQVRGLQRMVEDDRYCADIMTQISSAHEALRAVGRELMRNHLKHCATKATASPQGVAEPMYDELIEMMYRLSR